MERDFPHLFMHDFEGLLKSTGQVRAQGRWVAFVPLLENPIRLIDIESSTIVDLHTAARRAGRVTTVAREVVRDEQACPTCRREVHEVSSHRFEAVHADAVFAEESLWILGTEEPGSTEAVVYRFPLHWLRAPRDRVGDAIGLTRLASPPRALAIAYDHIIVATEDRLYWFERSRLERRWLGRPSEARGRSREGGACEAS